MFLQFAGGLCESHSQFCLVATFLFLNEFSQCFVG